MDLNDLINRIGIKPSTKRNGALDTYINNSQNKARLETLLSEFLRIINNKSAPDSDDMHVQSDKVAIYYNYIYKNLNVNYTLRDIEKFLNYPILHVEYNKQEDNDEDIDIKLGLFISAAINKCIKKGEEIHINSRIPIDYPLYKLKYMEAHVNIVCDDLGEQAKNSKIYAGETGDFLGCYANGCEIYAKEAGDYAGYYMQRCELHVKKAGNALGFGAINSKIYADKAGKTSYGGEEVYLIGKGMKDSEIYIDKLIGSLSDDIFKGNNEVYLGKESYNKFIQNYPENINKVKLWKKQKQNVDVFSGDYYGPK